MKIYFTASLTGKKYYEENYRKIVECLEKMGCTVFSEHIFRKSKEKIMNESRQERLDYHRLLNKNLKWCDAVVAEVSYPSTSVGYEICLAVKKGKPVLALHVEKGDFPPMLTVLKDEEIIVQPYMLSNLRNILFNYLEFIGGEAINKRFTLLLSPKIIKLLNKGAKKQKIPRSVYIRQLIEADMK